MTESLHRFPAWIRPLLPALACVGISSTARPGEAGVVVIGNHTERDVDFVVTPAEGEPQQYTLVPKDVLPLHVAREAEISFDAGGARRQPA